MARFAPLVVALLVLIAVISWPKTKSELTSKDYLDEIHSSSGQFDFSATKAVWFNKDVPVAPLELAQRIMANPDKVLGENNQEKWIEIDLTTQRLYAHEGNAVVFNFPISSGLPWFPTVTGEFHLWAKVRSQRMSGGDIAAGTFYDLPNVPFVQYFYQGYGLHGTYWHSDFGKPRSHGCINLSIPDAEKLFFWTQPLLLSDQYANTHILPEEGTKVVIHGIAGT